MTVQHTTLVDSAQPLRTHEGGIPSRGHKLLFLAYPFPPFRAVASVRTLNIAKYLTRLGWDVTVVTPHPSIWRYVDDPEETAATLRLQGIRRLLTGYRWRCLAPDHVDCWNRGLGWFVGGICRKVARHFGIDNGIGWIKAAERACSMVTPHDVDVILATGSPFAAFILAKRLSNRLGRPYVLDYRDPWTGNPSTAQTTRSAIIQKEARLLAGCAAATVVSPTWASALDSRFDLGPRLHVITNGYDPEELASVRPHNFGHFAVVYAGNFYPPTRIISPVMAALKRLKETLNGGGGEWYFHYYGVQENLVREEAKHFGVAERVVLHGNVPRTEALSAVRGAGVAVVIVSVAEENSIENKGWVPAKVFETLGLGVPILLVAPPGSDVEAIVGNTGLAHRFTGSDIDGMAAFLAGAVCGLIPEPRNLETYAWTTIAKRLDVVLRETVVDSTPNKTKGRS